MYKKKSDGFSSGLTLEISECLNVSFFRPAKSGDSLHAGASSQLMSVLQSIQPSYEQNSLSSAITFLQGDVTGIEERLNALPHILAEQLECVVASFAGEILKKLDKQSNATISSNMVQARDCVTDTYDLNNELNAVATQTEALSSDHFQAHAMSLSQTSFSEVKPILRTAQLSPKREVSSSKRGNVSTMGTPVKKQRLLKSPRLKSSKSLNVVQSHSQRWQEPCSIASLASDGAPESEDEGNCSAIELSQRIYDYMITDHSDSEDFITS